MIMFMGVPGYVGASSPEEADIIVFTGGEDVSPHIYGEKAHITTYANYSRDLDDKAVFALALGREQLMVGICRGGQFLNVMNGGRLYQDVDNHALFAGHHAVDARTGQEILVSSTHHQMIRRAKEGQLLMWAEQAKHKVTMDPTWRELDPDVDVESVWYPDTRSFCFQPHPEMEGFPACRQWFFETLDELYQSSISNSKKRA